MTVEELIKELEKYPKDKEVYRYNESPDTWYSDTVEYIFSVKEDEFGGLIIKQGVDKPQPICYN